MKLNLLHDKYFSKVCGKNSQTHYVSTTVLDAL